MLHSKKIFFRLQFIFTVKGTVILKIWRQLLLVLAIYTSTIVSLQYFIPGFKIKFQQSLIPILGTVIGFFLVFRSNTAYSRYWEGRCTWSNMTLYIRTLTRLIWVGVKEPSVCEIIEKKTAINLLVAFAYATKNYLREDYSYDQKDIRDLIKGLPKLSPRGCLNRGESLESCGKEEEYNNKNYKPEELNFKAHDIFTATNIPVELSLHLQAYIEHLRSSELCDVTLLKMMTSALGNLMGCLTSFERVLRTPIPLAYSVHLHQAVWLYLLALPYQLIENLNWWTVPAVVFASFSLLGILEIGWKIENPFGYDDNDLPLDDFCKVLQREINIITGYEIPSAESWLWSSDNQPFLPGSTANADELAKKSNKELRNILAENIESTTENTFLSYENLTKDSSDRESQLLSSLCWKSGSNSNSAKV